jgi:hypothetical protein
MENRELPVLAAFALVVAASSATLAHHGDVAYDTEKVVEVKNAVVTKLNWLNPHVFVQFDSKDDKGSVVSWVAEGGSPNALGLRNWTPTSITPGDIVTVYLYQSKSGRPVGRLNRVVRADGSVFRDSVFGYRDEEAPQKPK